MAALSKELPRDVQSDLHDMADKIGERVAEGDMVEVTVDGHIRMTNQNQCTCKRFSEEKTPGKMFFWNEPDPDCKYFHTQPLPQSFVITLP